MVIMQVNQAVSGVNSNVYCNRDNNNVLICLKLQSLQTLPLLHSIHKPMIFNMFNNNNKYYYNLPVRRQIWTSLTLLTLFCHNYSKMLNMSMLLKCHSSLVYLSWIHKMYINIIMMLMMLLVAVRLFHIVVGVHNLMSHRYNNNQHRHNIHSIRPITNSHMILN